MNWSPASVCRKIGHALQKRNESLRRQAIVMGAPSKQAAQNSDPMHLGEALWPWATPLV